jgi:hypothetical protein
MGSNKNLTLDQLTGHSVREALSELDDKQVLNLFQQLIDEREALIKRQEHLVSLSRLSEKTIAAADEVAHQIKEEAKNQAEAHASTILTEARTNAELLLADSRNQAINSVRSDLLAARGKYLTEFDEFSAKSISEFETKITSAVESVTASMIAYSEALKNQFSTFKKELETKLGELEATSFNENPDTAPAAVVTPSLQEKEPEAMAGREMRIVEILAPRDKDRIDGVRAHLDLLDDVIETNIKHLVDRTLIEVTLMKPMDLTHVMSDWPEVEMVQDMLIEGKNRTQVMLGVETEIAEERDILNHKINRIAHHIKPVN